MTCTHQLGVALWRGRLGTQLMLLRYEHRKPMFAIQLGPCRQVGVHGVRSGSAGHVPRCQDQSKDSLGDD